MTGNLPAVAAAVLEVLIQRLLQTWHDRGVGMLRAAGEWLGLVEPAGVGFAADPADEQVRQLDQFIVEFFASNGGRVGRAEALSVPALRKGRNLICTSVATLPLVTYAPDQRAHRSPFLDQVDPDVANVVTIAQTVEDLLCDSIAWWRVTGFGWDRYPVSARRLDPGTVSLDPPDGRSPAPLPHGADPRRSDADAKRGRARGAWVDGEFVDARELIRFDAPNPPLLSGARAIRRAILLDQAAAMYAEDPRPLDYFTPADGVDPVTDDKVQEIMRAWRAARRKRGTAYVPAALRYNSVDAPSPADLQLVELQRQSNLDLANLVGVDPEDLGVSTTSRTYANATDRRRDKVNEVLSGYMRAITDRLSMRDVCRRGWRVMFDLNDYMRADPATRWQVYAAANAITDDQGRPAITVAEIRQEERMPPHADVTPPATPAQPAPADDTAPAAPPAGDDQVDPDVVVDTVDAGREPVMTFDAGPAGITFDAQLVGFAADPEGRTVRGRIVPYGAVGVKFGRKFRFAPGALQFGADVGRVKLLRDHDTRALLGRATSLTASRDGADGVFSVAPGPEGDRALELAAHGTLDGFSVGVDFEPHDTEPDRTDPSVTVIRRATLREVSMVGVPAFDGARVVSVTASRDQEEPMPAPAPTTPPAPAGDTNPTPTTPPAPPAPGTPGATFAADQLGAAFAAFMQTYAGDPGPVAVDPAGPGPVPATAAVVNEPVPYRFDRGGNFAPIESPDQHVFSADLHAMADARDHYGTNTDAGRRVMALLRAAFDADVAGHQFASVSTANVTDLNPTIQRPDMYVDQRDFRTPLWDAINKGAPPNGVNPFRFPKFNTAAGLVGPHTEGVEPTQGTFTATGQTVTPAATSGKVSIPREVWDMGGNPAVSGLIFNQMRRGYREGLETGAATFLNTLTAATDIAIPVAAVDGALADAWDSALADLQFVRGYDFDMFALEKVLYKAFVAAEDTTGRRLYPQNGPSNTNGTAASRFRTLDLGGVTGVPSWALASTPGSLNNSWLFDRSTVHGWATAPMRLEFPGTSPTTPGSYAPVAMIDLAIWGYHAEACSDIGGVRQVTYDSVAP